nr:hypothetical protein [Tanacetum cinerariifolium]
MLDMHKNEKEIAIYATTENTFDTNELQQRGQDKDVAEQNDDDDVSDNFPREESYHSNFRSDDEVLNDEGETYLKTNKSPIMKVNLKFVNVVQFRRACSMGFLAGFHPYISLDACHLKGKFNGVLVVVATGIEGNSSMFSVAYGILESENTQSWIWFLKLLKKAIGTLDGTYIATLKKVRGDFFNIKLWGAARTYCINEHDRLLNEIAGVSKEAIAYLHDHHKKIWIRCKFGTTSKCNYITNNISEAFNSWVGDLRYQPVLTLLDDIRDRLMNLGRYEVCRSSDNRADVMHKGKCWEVILDERKCTCRVWQVRGLPCVHAVAFISFMRDNNWDKFVDPYFTIKKLKEAYALEIAPFPTKDQSLKTEMGEKIYPPVIKRPHGRLRKNRIVPHDEGAERLSYLRLCTRYKALAYAERVVQGIEDGWDGMKRGYQRRCLAPQMLYSVAYRILGVLQNGIQSTGYSEL